MRVLHGHHPSRGLTLIELLMAIMILGIGVISIAAIFPAGIAQQRQSVDDVLGGTVANNALEVIRAKLSQEDFGTYEEFRNHPQGGPYSGYSSPTIVGDWPWTRPAFFKDDTSLGGLVGGVVSAGSISVFDGELPASTDIGRGLMPYNLDFYPIDDPPDVIFMQGERAYPMYRLGDTEGAARAQYHWDCMFRRFQGRVQVAIFVYRVTNATGDRRPYAVAPNASDSDVPPLPVWLDLIDAGTEWDAPVQFPTPAGANLIAGTNPAGAFDPFDQTQSWQIPGQWILDQNANIHRVLGAYEDDDGARAVELIRPPSPVPALPVNDVDRSPNVPVIGATNVVRHLWYIPRQDSQGRLLTPVYVLVEEL